MFECELFLTHGAHIALGAGVCRQVVVVVEATGVALATRLTLVAGQLLVDVFHVLVEAAPTGQGTLTVRAHKAPVLSMVPLHMTPQVCLVCKDQGTNVTLVRILALVVSVCLPVQGEGCFSLCGS